MKKGIVITAIVVLCVVIFHVGVTVGAGNGEPGSASDPLITQSYLEKRLEELGGSTSTTSGLIEVSVKSGEQIVFEKGSELIVYSGSGVVATGTFVNLSSGSTFTSGTNLVKYNVLLGTNKSTSIKATSDMTVYIRGKYSMN